MVRYLHLASEMCVSRFISVPGNRFRICQPLICAKCGKGPFWKKLCKHKQWTGQLQYSGEVMKAWRVLLFSGWSNAQSVQWPAGHWPEFTDFRNDHNDHWSIDHNDQWVIYQLRSNHPTLNINVKLMIEWTRFALFFAHFATLHLLVSRGDHCHWCCGQKILPIDQLAVVFFRPKRYRS